MCRFPNGSPGDKNREVVASCSYSGLCPICPHMSDTVGMLPSSVLAEGPGPAVFD